MPYRSLAPLQRAARLPTLVRSSVRPRVVRPRVFAPQFVTYDLQFRRCLSLRIEIYGLAIARERRSMAGRGETRIGPMRAWLTCASRTRVASRLHLNQAAVSLAISLARFN